jgi:nitroreductase
MSGIDKGSLKMDTLEAIYTRRSIRKYTKKLVFWGLVTELFKAAVSAPSAVNAQHWVFIVTDEQKLLEEIPTFSPHASMCGEAPLSILVRGDTTQEKIPGYWVQDCSAATQNLLLAAHAFGLGAVWPGLYPMKIELKGLGKLLSYLIT